MCYVGLGCSHNITCITSSRPFPPLSASPSYWLTLVALDDATTPNLQTAPTTIVVTTEQDVIPPLWFTPSGGGSVAGRFPRLEREKMTETNATVAARLGAGEGRGGTVFWIVFPADEVHQTAGGGEEEGGLRLAGGR